MKSGFKYIVIFIIGSLSIVFLIQLFWLEGLYSSIKTETEKEIIECLRTANTYEIAYRLDSIEALPKTDRPTGEISIGQSITNEENEDGRMFIQSRRVMKDGDTIQSVKEVDEGDFNLLQFDRISVLIREALHQTLDSVAPVRLDIVYSSLCASFKEKGMKSKIYRLEVLDFDSDIVMESMDFIEENTSYSQFAYVYDPTNNIGYQIRIEALTRTVLNQMLGILATTFLIVLILGFAFWYLIRTILLQKTLEEMKEDFTNNMTHELKTPIAVAYSATDVLLNFGQADNKERREKYLAICKEQLEKLSGLVEQILSMSMERRLKFILKEEYIQLKGVLETLAEQHRIKAGKEVAFNIDIQPHDLTLYADKTHLTNIIGNLIDNAIKYSHKSIAIDIKAYKEVEYYVIEIKDNGIGIPPDKQKYLFEKFYRVPQGNKHNAKGYGIGLFYVKTVVEKHGGTISVKSIVDKGSVFTIKIPLEK